VVEELKGLEISNLGEYNCNKRLIPYKGEENMSEEQKNPVEKKKRKKWPWIIVVVIILVIIAAQSCGGEQPTAISSNGSAEPKSSAEQSNNSKAGKTTFKIGETVKYNNVELTVTNFKTTKGGEYDSPKSGNEYAIVTVKYKNAGKENISYNPYDFKIRNSKGQITDNTYVSSIEKDKLDSGDLAPNGEIEGTIAFEVPKGDKGLVLQYTGNIFNSESEIDFKLA
jgi:flagellar basal body-associated protein FliL